MNAIELGAFEGFDSLRLVEVEKPRPGVTQILIQVKAAGINFAELELAKGDTRFRERPLSLWDLKPQEL